jgi:hypothetical protein
VFKVQLAADGAGGVFAAWEHAGAGASLVRAQHVGSGGIAAWAGGGVVLCPGGAGQFSPHLVSDGAGGTIAVFEDYRSAARYDVYAQRLDASGVLAWGAGGAPVCTAAGAGVGEAWVVPGPNSAAIAVWDDFRGLPYESDLFATRLLGTGGMGPTAVPEPGRATGALALGTPYPQPARGRVTFRYRAANGGAGRLELFDLSGRRVRELEATLASGAEGTLTLALVDDAGAALPAGGYTARLSASGDVARVPVVILR